ncbi:hypothetical protein C8P68_106280 [Mucilaginibacter yixingensis]|uniref:Uncharacterized protein n=1 Tax=Mucilaginibacter yixingensis TaxID=1295612 RepID=A0A2T5J7E3_9SPHI|nr:hypothetical protein [Mucilaginibacter yixingensis]PTQ95065.1 hypothetical protein C8P68_106280 [Mucilaginibacter yixingensis]
MKIKYWLLGAALMGSGILSACRMGGNGTKIEVSSNRYEYKFSARYNSDITPGVEQYINEQIKPTSILNSQNHRVDLAVILADHTNFNIKSSPGRLDIEMNKKDNTGQSYTRVNNLCAGIRNFILSQPHEKH